MKEKAAQQPGMHRKVPMRWKPIVIVTGALALVAIAGKELAGPTGDEAASQGAEPAAVAASASTASTATTVQAPRTEAVTSRIDMEPQPQPQQPQQPQTPAPPPPRNRSLCSAASEAAGLCNPQ